MVFRCVWKQWYIYDMWNVKGFIVALCHHWIYCIPGNTMELTNGVKKNQDKPWWTCPGLNMAKRQAWNCISKDFLFYITFFFRNLFMKRPFKRHGWCKRWGCQLKFGFPAKGESVWHCFEFRLGLMEFTAGVYCWMIFWRSEFWMPLRVFYNEDQNNFSKNFSRLWAIPELR